MKWAPGATEGVLVAGGNGSGSNLNQIQYAYGFDVTENGTIYQIEIIIEL